MPRASFSFGTATPHKMEVNYTLGGDARSITSMDNY